MNNNSKNKFNVSEILTFLSLTISVIAILYTHNQFNLTKTHNQISVTPILTITPYVQKLDKKNGIFISNEGVGPAILTDFAVKIKNKSFSGLGEDKWRDVLAIENIESSCFKSGWPTKVTAIKEGKEFALIQLSDNCLESHINLLKLTSTNAIEITIFYKSLYDEEFSITESTLIQSKDYQEKAIKTIKDFEEAKAKLLNIKLQKNE